MTVEARNLSLPGRLQETSIELRRGELTCLIGPNGSGKTSLLHALAGIGAAGGKVAIDGVDPVRLSPAQRMRLLSYLPASRDANWPLTGIDLIALGCAGPEERRNIPELLRELDLGSFAERRIDRLSTGERSRILIARALVSRPKLLLLDEPASNLDPLWQLRLMDYLQRLAPAGGQALLVAMHDLGLARDYADRLVVMNEGRIAADGDPSELLAGPGIARIFGIEQRNGRWRPAAQAG
jgi:iron complex transport system ATP-binding protein